MPMRGVVKTTVSIYWRASLVPAAAVIPAPRAYANAVAVKKFVVGFGSTLYRKATCCPRDGVVC